MKPAGIVGIILIIVGLVGFAWGGLGWTTQKKDAQLGPLEITHKESHGIAFPPVASGICLVGGIGKFGLQVQELTKEVAERLHVPVEQGVVVTDVEDNSIAAAQDIQREDVVTEVDGKPVTNLQSFREALNKADPKRGVLLYLDRKGTKTFAVLKASG